MQIAYSYIALYVLQNTLTICHLLFKTKPLSFMQVLLFLFYLWKNNEGEMIVDLLKSHSVEIRSGPTENW